MAGRTERHTNGQEPVEILTPEMMRKVRRLEIRTRALVEEIFAGEYHSAFKGQGMEFAEVREYVPGDDIRTIDWNVTARFGAPFVKKFVEERETTVFFLVDASGSQAFGSRNRSKVELAAEVVAILGFSAMNNQDKVGLLIFSNRVELLVPPRKGRRHGLRLLREILWFQPEGVGTDIASASEAALAVLKRRSIVFILSDFLVPLEPLEQSLGALARRHDVVALKLRDPIEAALPELGLLEVEDLETGRRALIDTSDAASAEALGRAFEGHSQAVSSMLRRHGIDEAVLEVGADPVEPLLRLFKLRERRMART